MAYPPLKLDCSFIIGGPNCDRDATATLAAFYKELTASVKILFQAYSDFRRTEKSVLQLRGPESENGPPHSDDVKLALKQLQQQMESFSKDRVGQMNAALESLRQLGPVEDAITERKRPKMTDGSAACISGIEVIAEEIRRKIGYQLQRLNITEPRLALLDDDAASWIQFEDMCISSDEDASEAILYYCWISFPKVMNKFHQDLAEGDELLDKSQAVELTFTFA